MPLLARPIALALLVVVLLVGGGRDVAAKKPRQTTMDGPEGWARRTGYCTSTLPREPYERTLEQDSLICTSKCAIDKCRFVSIIRVQRNMFMCSFMMDAGCEDLQQGRLEAAVFENPDWSPPIGGALTLSELGEGVCVQAPPPKNNLYKPGFQVFNSAFTVTQCRDLCNVQPEKYKFFSVLEAFDNTGACFCYGNCPRRDSTNYGSYLGFSFDYAYFRSFYIQLSG